MFFNIFHEKQKTCYRIVCGINKCPKTKVVGNSQWVSLMSKEFLWFESCLQFFGREVTKLIGKQVKDVTLSKLHKKKNISDKPERGGEPKEWQMTASATLTQLFILNGVRNDDGMCSSSIREKHNTDAVITTASIKYISNTILKKMMTINSFLSSSYSLSHTFLGIQRFIFHF